MELTDDEFLAAFEACTLPRSAWTHAAHVRMAWLYLGRWPFARAVLAIRTGIRRYNESLGNTTGYHDTVTVAFARLIAAARLPGEGFDHFRGRCPELFAAAPALLSQYYSTDLLDGDAARELFVEPDRQPLPG